MNVTQGPSKEDLKAPSLTRIIVPTYRKEGFVGGSVVPFGESAWLTSLKTSLVSLLSMMIM